MARSFNIKSATFNSGGAQALGAPVNGRTAVQGEVVNESAGVDAFVVQQRLTRRKVTIQISFNDHDNMQNLQNSFIGATGNLVLVVPDDASPPVDQTATISNVMLAEVIGDAQHAAFGSHIATFEAVSSDGTTNPIVWV